MSLTKERYKYYVILSVIFFLQRVRDQFDSSAFPDLASDLTAAFADMEHSDLILRCGDADFPCHRFDTFIDGSID